MSIGDRLKALREDRDLKQEDVAKYMDVDRSTVGKWESSPSKPNPEMIVKLANFYGVTTDYILGNTVPPSFSDSNTIESKETSSSDKKLSDLNKNKLDEINDPLLLDNLFNKTFQVKSYDEFRAILDNIIK